MSHTNSMIHAALKGSTAGKNLLDYLTVKYLNIRTWDPSFAHPTDEMTRKEAQRDLVLSLIEACADAEDATARGPTTEKERENARPSYNKPRTTRRD